MLESLSETMKQEWKICALQALAVCFLLLGSLPATAVDEAATRQATAIPNSRHLDDKRALLEPQTEALLAYLKKAGALPADYSLDGFLQELKPERGDTWLYRSLAIALLVIAFASAIAYRLSRLSAALTTSEARFRLVADNAQDVLWKYDLHQKCLSYISPAIERMTGYTVNEAMAQSIDDSFTTASAEAVRTAVEFLATHPDETKSVVELELRRKDGSTVWSEATMSLIHGPGGAVTEVVGVSRDVTARRLAQEQQKRFLAMVSHEFRTPMNAILGMAELLAETELTAEQGKYLDVFQNAGTTLLDLINDILDLSKVEAGQFQLYQEDFALAPILQEQIALLSPRARDKGLSLILDIGADVPAFVNGDAQRLKQCITNLVGNALKFCHEGSITIAVERDPQAPAMLHMAVTDTGIGIPPDKLGAIFEAFNQADSQITRNYGGTGLGLTITQRLVELMAGRIWVESTPGQGSSFHFTVRMPEVSPTATKAEAKPAQELATLNLGRPLAILLAEDNQNNVFLMRSLLKSTPCEVEVADNGAMAVEKFRTKTYDLILMDMEMPVMDGLAATRAIRRIEQQEGLRQTQIFSLTAHAFKEDEQKSLAAGCNGHLTKPIRKQVLLHVLNTLPLVPHDGAAAVDAQQTAQAGNAHQFIAELPGSDQFDFQAALAHLEIDNELFLTVLGLFREALPGYSEGIAQALGCGDFSEARRQAHSLKGEAATVGALHLSTAAAELQAAIDKGDAESYAPLQERLAELSTAAARVLADLPLNPSKT